MDAIQVLLERNSMAQLSGKVTEAQLEILLKAALRAADHGWLHPTRFITVQGNARAQLGKIFLESTDDWQNLSVEKQNKLEQAPLRAPLLIIVVNQAQDHPKIPRLEQLLSSAAGAQNILNAAAALGLGAIWRTGDVAHNPQVAKGLGLAQNEQIVGFVYVGEAAAAAKALPELDLGDFVQSFNTN